VKQKLMVGGSSPSPVLVFAFCAACIFGQLLHLAQAQNETTAVTDPAEGISLSLSLSLSITNYPVRKGIIYIYIYIYIYI
jgi:hypothetical protein